MGPSGTRGGGAAAAAARSGPQTACPARAGHGLLCLAGAGTRGVRADHHQVVGHVLPFRVNSYVVDELIDWSRVPDDPIFRLTFPQAEMLSAEMRAIAP